MSSHGLLSSGQIGRVVFAGLALATIAKSQLATAQPPDFDRATLERIVSGRDAADRGEQRRAAAIERQLDLQYYLPWRSGIGPGSYYWGAPYFGPAYPGIAASYSAGAFYGRAYRVPAAGERNAESANNPPQPGFVAGLQPNGFVAERNENGRSPPLISSAVYGAFGIGGVGIAGGVNPLFAGLPGWLNAFEPSPYIPGFIYGYPYVGAVEQPLGHRILSAGARGYIYEPVYAGDLARDASQASVASVPDRQSATFPVDDAGGEDVLPGEPLSATPRETPRSLSRAGQRSLQDAVESFQRQNYRQAIKALDQLRREGPPHFSAELLRAQTLFALGDYAAASTALSAALQGLPEKEWGLIVENYLDYYLLDKPFQLQLQKLEEHVGRHPDSGSAALLLGYEYGYLGYPIEAAEQLIRAAELAPHDRIAARLAAKFSALADRQRAARGLPPAQRRPPAVPKPEGVENGPREF